MNGWRTPIGPRPARTYWLRRLAVVVAVLLVLGLLGALAVAFLPRHQPAVSTAPRTTPAPVGRQAEPTPATTTAPPSPGTPACDPAKTRIDISGDAAVRSGDKYTFKLSVVNDSGAECVLEVNPTSMALTVSSGNDRIWSTQDCEQWLGQSAKQAVAPGQGVAWTLEWPTRRSQASCQLTDDYLRPGTYVARAVFGGNTRSLVVTLRG